jgi:hypothetical protein
VLRMEEDAQQTSPAQKELSLQAPRASTGRGQLDETRWME